MRMTRQLFIPAKGPLLGRRLVQLVFGLIAFGFGIALMLQSGLGVPPWDVLHQGLAERFGLSVGIWSIIVSVFVLVLWIPIREPYGIGTLLNAIIIGLAIDGFALIIPAPEAMVWRAALLTGGILVIGFTSGMYIGAKLGPGPRDGLMTGIAKFGPSVRLTRTTLEIVVLAAGWALGGTFGVGTIAFALLIGPIVQLSFRIWPLETRPKEEPDTLKAR
jgi:uncharacterized membrane protein YczE